MSDECEPAEIFVLGKKNAVFAIGPLHQFLIDGSLLLLRYGDDIVAASECLYSVVKLWTES